jgi:hypothetical protein
MPETVVSLQLWATEHRGALIAGTLAIAAFLTTLIIGAKPLARVYQTSSEPARLHEPGQASKICDPEAIVEQSPAL